MKRLVTHSENGAKSIIDPTLAYTPHLEDVAEAFGNLIVHLRNHGVLGHEDAMRVCGKRGVYEDDQ